MILTNKAEPRQKNAMGGEYIITVHVFLRHLLTLCAAQVACTVTVQAIGGPLYLVTLLRQSNDHKHVG
uniref:Uncharacterized protein n=1 Tax=Hyaloperonospora arabidopsidis (strain Emoy2) TaxID=559515 RepID=M4BNX5_HYAAE